MLYSSETTLEVRYYETDQMGIVHHSNYIRYFEYGRTKLMEEAGMPITKIEEMGVELPVVTVECKYILPAKMGDTLKIVSKVEKEPTARIEIFTDIYNQKGEHLCTGKVVLGFLSKERHRPVRVPEYFLNALLASNNL